MKKILIISDSHNNQKLLRTVLEREKEIDIVFHLGDYYNDTDSNPDLFSNSILIRVPGLYHEGYINGSLPKSQIVSICNWYFLLCHTAEIINPEHYPDIDIFCFGHTHRKEFLQKNSKYFINPGHLKNETDRNCPATYAYLEITEEKLELLFKDINGNTIEFNILKRIQN